MALLSVTIAQNQAAAPSELFRTMSQNKWDILNHPDHLTQAAGQLGVVWAVIFVILGAICILSGYKWHKAVILVLALLAGGIAGRLLGLQISVASEVTAIAGATLFAVLAWPIMRYTVALFAGLAGAFLGANAWTAMGQPQEQHYIGAMIGLLVLGMLAFITFRIVIIAFTSIGGAGLLTIGGLALLLNMESWRSGVEGSLTQNPLVIPIITGSAAIFGVIFQQGGGVKGLIESADQAEAQSKAKKKPAPA